MLHLSGSSQRSPIQISDTLVTVPFRGPEYIIPPGAEGVASLVFDVPRDARGARGGLLEGDYAGLDPKESLFEVQCTVSVKMSMGFGRFAIFILTHSIPGRSDMILTAKISYWTYQFILFTRMHSPLHPKYRYMTTQTQRCTMRKCLLAIQCIPTHQCRLCIQDHL
jgi:hypothetical protein